MSTHPSRPSGPFPRFLHLEDSLADAGLVGDKLEAEWPGCQVTVVSHSSAFEEALGAGDFDLILSDHSLPGFDGLTALDLARSNCPDKPFVFLSGTIGEERAVEALQRGASDYIIKDRPARLIAAIRNALAQAAAQRRRRAAEKALRVTQERFRKITENVGDMIAVCDRNGGSIYLNPACARVVGEKGSSLESGFITAVHADDRSKLTGRFEKIAATGETHECEFRMLLANGSLRAVEAHLSPIRDDSDPTANILAVLRDVTEERRNDRKLRQQAALLDKARDAIVVVDGEERVTYWNPTAERLYEWSKADVLGRPFFELGLGHDAGRVREARDRLVAEGEWRGHFTLQSKTGQIMQVESTWSLIPEDEGKSTAFLVIDTDVTERRKLETQILQTQRVESIGTLAGGIAHDLNNVLAPIMMGSELLRLRLSQEAELRLVNTIHATAKHGADLIRKLLVFARGLPGERSSLLLSDLLQELDPLIRQSLRADIEFATSAVQAESAVVGDATQLKQVVLNLCINARDAMPQGGRLQIEIGSVEVDGTFRRRTTDGKSGPHVCLTISDTGTGIPPAVIDRIFDPFFTTKDIGKGTGLGLSMVLGIVKSHDGFVTVESEVGKGTTFRIYLPVANIQAEKVEATNSLLPARGHGETLLLVEAEESVRTMISSLLDHQGYRAISVSDAVDGVERFRASPASVAAIIVGPGVRGPANDGLVVGLRQIYPKTRLVIIQEGLQALSKDQESLTVRLQWPFESRKLLAELHHLIGTTV